MTRTWPMAFIGLVVNCWQLKRETIFQRRHQDINSKLGYLSNIQQVPRARKHLKISLRFALHFKKYQMTFKKLNVRGELSDI